MLRGIGRLLRALVSVAGLLLIVVGVVWVTFGGGGRVEDRTTEPKLNGSALEKVVDLDYPPGNVAVSKHGRVFFTFHPGANPPLRVAELKAGKIVAYPSVEFQHPGSHDAHFQSPLALRIDRFDRLWVLDPANYGLGTPRLLAFDLETNKLVHRYDFPREVAGTLSMLNDFQVDPSGTKIYITDTSPFLQNPALIVYDVLERFSRRLLEDHPSVRSGNFAIHTPERVMRIFGFLTLRIAVDSIALDPNGEWLYYGPLTGDRLYRVRTADLHNEDLKPGALAARVEDYAAKPITDGLSADLAGNLYLTDPEHNAVHILGPDRKLQTAVRDDRLRWPDGLSFGPDGWLYVTCSSLQHVLFVSDAHMRAHVPYQIFRFKPGTDGVPGH